MSSAETRWIFNWHWSVGLTFGAKWRPWRDRFSGRFSVMPYVTVALGPLTLTWMRVDARHTWHYTEIRDLRNRLIAATHALYRIAKQCGGENALPPHEVASRALHAMRNPLPSLRRKDVLRGR